MGTHVRHDSGRSIRWRVRAAAIFVSLVLACPLDRAWLSVGMAEPEAAPDISKESGLVQRIRAALDDTKLGGALSVSVVDARTGRGIFSFQADRPMSPASNQKLVTTAATLLELGADFRILTGVYGQVQDGAVVSGLYLKGYGDPSLSGADLNDLAEQLAARGIKQVDEVVVDGSYFDDQTLPPGFETQPNEMSAFRAAVAAVSVNENAYTLRVTPGRTAGAQALVWVDAEGYFALQNTLTTSEGGAPNVIADQRPKGDTLTLKVSGSVPLGTPTLTYRRRVEAPLPYAGYALVEALRAYRIQTPRRVRLGKLPSGLALLASHRSPPLSTLLYALGKQSDNFTAEMLLKVLAAERVGSPGKTANGARVALQALDKLGVRTSGMRTVNGSGLFGDNRVSAAQLTALLHGVYARPDLRPELIAQLAIGGVDGTLAERFTQLPAPRIVRAKTGTLADVIALSGYVLGRAADRALAFSVLANGVAGKGHVARALADRIVTDMAWHLWSADKPAP